MKYISRLFQKHELPHPVLQLLGKHFAPGAEEQFLRDLQEAGYVIAPIDPTESMEQAAMTLMSELQMVERWPSFSDTYRVMVLDALACVSRRRSP